MNNELNALRKEIDEIDNQLKTLLIKRMSICLDIAKYKSRNNLPKEDVAREKQIIERLKRNEKFPGMIECIYPAIFTFSKTLQNKVK